MSSPLDCASTRELLEAVAARMRHTQNSTNGRDLGVLCVEALANLAPGVLDYRPVPDPPDPLGEVPEGGVVLDADDAAVYAVAFRLAAAVERFVGHGRVPEMLDLLRGTGAEESVIDDLRQQNREMTEARVRRVERARARAAEERS